MNNFLEQVGVALIKFADAYSVKTAAMMKNAEANEMITKYNVERDTRQNSQVQKREETHLPPVKPALKAVEDPQKSEPIPEPQEEIIPEETVKPTATDRRQELIDQLEGLGVAIPPRTRTTTLETMLEKALAAAAKAPQGQAPAPVSNTSEIKEERVREYMKIYYDKFGMAEVGALVTGIAPGCKNISDVAAQPNATELFAKLVEACIEAGVIIVTSKGA